MTWRVPACGKEEGAVTMPKTIVTLLLLVATFALLSLVFGASYLETMLPGGLPLGNALTAIGLCAAATAAIWLSAHRAALRIASIISLIGAVAWLPVSIALAGNLTLNLYGGHGVAWLSFSFAILAAVFGTLIWALAVTLLAKNPRAGTA